MLRVLLALSVVVLAPLGLRAEETYKLKLRRDRQVGDRFRVDSTEKNTHKREIKDADGNLAENVELHPDRSSIYEETVLAVDGKKHTTKSTRKYEKATMRQGDKDEDVPLIGKTVIIERKDGKAEFSLEGGGDLPEFALKFLQEEFKNKDDDKD